MNYRYTTLVLLIIVTILASLFPGCSNTEESQSNDPLQIIFPEDEGAHPESSVEWWYLNASLQDTQGKEYTAMVAYFTPAMRIISISDLETETFYQDSPRVTDLLSPTNSYVEGTLDLSWDDTDRWYRTDSDTLTYSLKAEGETIGLDLDIVSHKAPLMVGGDGLVEWTEGSTYYYSLTRLQVDGQIEFDGKTLDVEGTGWMDHQWMEEAVPNGWDWFSVQLDDNTDIIFWQIVDKDGLIKSRDMTMMFADESIYHTVDLDIEKLSSWTSPETGETYGTTWRITETGHNLDLEVTARYNEQEIFMFADVPLMSWQFWEGSITVSGEMDGVEVSGIGYAELVPFNDIMNFS